MKSSDIALEFQVHQPVTSAASTVSSSPSSLSSPSTRSSSTVVNFEEPPAIYKSRTRHSPLTRGVVEQLRARLQRSGGRPDVFAKIGDSITISGDFLRCLDGEDIQWGDHPALKETLQFFRHTKVDERSSSWGRATEAARVGWRTERILQGVPTPLDQELLAVQPAWALVMLGTNDTYADSMRGYAIALRTLLDALLKKDVIPLLSTIPPRRDKTEAREQVLEMNAVVRMLAQARQIPLMDLWGSMEPLYHAGLARDGIHPQAYRDDQVHPCWFDAQGLTAGMNQRNLLVLEALDRVRRKILEQEPPDLPGEPISGNGSWENPVMLPASNVYYGTLQGGTSRVKSYTCDREQWAGPERVHRVEVQRATKLRIRLFSEGKSRMTMLWLSTLSPPGCDARARSRLDLSVQPGTYWLVVDSGSEKDAASYGLTLLER